MYVCMYVCMYVFMYVCMYVCINWQCDSVGKGVRYASGVHHHKHASSGPVITVILRKILFRSDII